MKKIFLPILVVSATFAGCASVPTQNKEMANTIKQFKKPSGNMAGLYVYRKGGMGSALKKDIWVDGKCLGKSAPKVFFYQPVTGNIKHTITTQSEFGTNDLVVNTKAGQNYYIKQYIKMGLVMGGANLKLMNAKQGQADIAKLKLALQGECSKELNK